MNRVEEYAVGVPEETRMILASLDNPVRQAILMLLSQKGELSFSAIQKELAGQADFELPFEEPVCCCSDQPLL